MSKFSAIATKTLESSLKTDKTEGSSPLFRFLIMGTLAAIVFFGFRRAIRNRNADGTEEKKKFTLKF